MDELGEKSQSSSPTTMSQPEDHELSVCFCAATEKKKKESCASTVEWYVFNISDNDFKYKPKKVARTRRHRIGDNIRSLIEEVYYVEDHHHCGDGVYGMRKLSPVSRSKHYDYQTCVALGSTIFCLGRDLVSKTNLRPKKKKVSKTNPIALTEWLNEFLCLDINNPSDDWKKVTPMIGSRSKPEIVVVDGKLYALCLTDPKVPDYCAHWDDDPDGCAGWAEVYDPTSGEWEVLPEPPSRRTRWLIALDAPKRIVSIGGYSFTPMYIYDEATKSWEEDKNTHLPCCTPLPGFKNFEGKHVVVGHTMYWLCKGQINAYSFNQRKWFMGYIQGLQRDYCFLNVNGNQNNVCLLHLGGENFCILWAQTVPLSDSDSGSDYMHGMQLDIKLRQSQIHCVKLRISIGTKDHRFRTYRGETKISGSLNVTMESCQSYFIDHEITLLDALVLDGKLGKEEQLDEESAISRGVVNVLQ